MTNEVTEASAAEIIAWLRSPEGEAWSEHRLCEGMRETWRGEWSFTQHDAHMPSQPLFSQRRWNSGDDVFVLMRGMFSIERQPGEREGEADSDD